MGVQTADTSGKSGDMYLYTHGIHALIIKRRPSARSAYESIDLFSSNVRSVNKA